MAQREKPDYGVDAPGLMRFFLGAGTLALAASLSLARFLHAQNAVALAAIFILAALACYLMGMGCLMLYGSKVTKVVERESLLDQIPWRGDENVLDVGCGRGLMLIGAARRLTSGKAVGVDVWLARDQSANSADGARDNARIEGVGDKVSLETADARSLPFPDGAFDVVLSHWVVHNLAGDDDRARALAEMARVLRAGGHLILSDIAHRDAYFSTLGTLGLTDRRIVYAPLKDAVLKTVSFGSFRPSTIVACKPA